MKTQKNITSAPVGNHSLPSRSRDRMPLCRRVTANVTAMLALCAVLGFSPDCRAQSFWTNPGGGFWLSGSNWSGGSPPAPGDTAIFDLPPGEYNVLWNDGFGDSVNAQLVVDTGFVNFLNTSSSTRTHTVVGNTVVSGANSSLSVGSFPDKNLHLISGGFVVNNAGRLVATAGGSISTAGQMSIVSGELIAQEGGIINASIARIGDGGFVTALVTGAGSQLNNGSQFGEGLTVGRAGGAGHLTIRNGGVVSASSTRTSIGSGAGSTGSVHVEGPGSRLVLDSIWQDDLYIGDGGLGVLTISNGGAAINRQAFVGDDFSGLGSIHVFGGGATWQIESLRMVNGSLLVESGGLATMDFANIGEFGSGTSSVDVSGTGTQMIAADVIVGRDSRGILRVNQGGIVNSSLRGLVGIGEGAVGSVSVSGTGSAWNIAGHLLLGFQDGEAETYAGLAIESGGSVTSSSARLGEIQTGATGNATGNVFVRGTGSRWNNLGQLTIGESGTGILSIEDGGVVENAGWSYIGYEAGSSGTVTVTGDGSQWNINDSLQVGRFGSGTLSIANGGSVSVVNLAAVDVDGQINNNNGNFVSNTVINQVGGIISGHGQFTAVAGWDNFGLIFFDGGQSNVYGNINNRTGGIIGAGDASTTFFHGDFAHNGSEIALGAGSSFSFLGRVSGLGDFIGTGTVKVTGELSPGNSPGSMSFGGDLIIDETASLMIELGGLATNEFDRLIVGGDLVLDGGDLNVELWNDFALSSGMKFLFAEVEGELFGQFNGLGEGSLVGNFGGRDLFITYNGFDGIAGVGLFTAVPEPSMVSWIVLVAGLSLCRRSRRQF